jgi:hypothetical protein
MTLPTLLKFGRDSMGEYAVALIFVIPALICAGGLWRAYAYRTKIEEPEEEINLNSFNRYRDWN